MAIPPIGPAAPVAPPVPASATQPQAAGFGDALGRGLEQVSDLEHRADDLIQQVATGGEAKVHETMIATTQAALAVDTLVQVRDRALDAYHEIMRMQL